MKQKFSASIPNTVWLADIAYEPPGEGSLYLAAVLDLATRKMVGWSMRDHMRTELTTAIEAAIGCRSFAGSLPE